MTDYGLTATGFIRPSASQIRQNIVSDITGANQFRNARTSTGSVFGNLIDPFVNQLSIAWEGAEGAAHAFDPDSVSNQAEDNLFAAVGQSRNLATYSTVTLTLATFGASLVPVPAGNLAEQSSTGILWETLDDIDIPAATVAITQKAIGQIEWRSATTVRYYIEATDLSSVTAGMLLYVDGCNNTANDGLFEITSVNDGADWIEATNPQRTDSSLDEADSDGDAWVTDGFVTIDAQSATAGEFPASAQTIDSIYSPVSGWDAVGNLTDALQGRDTETDAEFKIRKDKELATAQGSIVEAIAQKLRDIQDVTYVSGYSIDDQTDPEWGYHFTVVGGLDQDIWDIIGQYKAGGIPTRGTEAGTYTDSYGVSYTIRFSRATEKLGYFIVNISAGSDYPSDGDDLVSAAMVSFGELLEVGEDILNHKVSAAISNADIPGVNGIEVLAAFTPSPTLANNLPIATDEIGVIQADHITVNS